jgi:3-phenylpropionate/trans-cinnamate dioxygenase ferredoxin component
MVYNYNTLDPEACEFLAVATAGEIGEGERLNLEIDDIALVIFRIGGKLFAIGDVCSHDDGPLGEGELDGFDVICPRHGARFDVRDGTVKQLPAVVDIPAYPVREINGEIEVGLPIT